MNMVLPGPGQTRQPRGRIRVILVPETLGF